MPPDPKLSVIKVWEPRLTERCEGGLTAHLLVESVISKTMWSPNRTTVGLTPPTEVYGVTVTTNETAFCARLSLLFLAR